MAPLDHFIGLNQIQDKPLHEQIVTQFADVYLRHKATIT